MFVFRRCATEGLIKSTDSVITSVVGKAEPVPHSDLNSAVTLLEPQIPSVIPEVIPQPFVPHCAQNSFSLTPTLPSKQTGVKSLVEICSSTQTKHTPPLSSSSKAAVSNAHFNRSCSSEAPAPFIEEIISHSKGKNRAPSIEVSLN